MQTAAPRSFDNAFVGRSALLARTVAAIAQGKSVALVGPPGIGKTRLAAEVMRQTPEASFVSFADVTTIEGFVGRVGDALGLALPLGAATDEHVDRIARAFATRGPATWVFDNLEQLDAGADAILDTWIRACAASFLVTSRRLVSAGLERVELAPLSTTQPGQRHSDAALLLRSRAREIARVELDDDELDAADALVRALDGLPLAIELAATRLAVLTPTALLARLDRRFDTLAPSEGRGLREAIATSIQLLTPAARACLVACTPFRGGIPLRVLEAATRTPDLLDALETLRNHSLLTVWRDGDQVRYELAHSIRDYVEQTFPDEVDAVGVPFARAWSTEAAERRGSIRPIDRESFQAAFEVAERVAPELTPPLVLALTDPTMVLPYRTSIALLARALAKAEADDLPTAEMRLRRGTYARFVGDLATADLDLGAARAACERLGAATLLAEVYVSIAETASARSAWDDARHALRLAMDQNPTPAFRAHVASKIANTYINVDDFARAEPALEEGIALAEEAGDLYAEGMARLSRGIMRVEAGSFDQAFHDLMDALSIFDSMPAATPMQAQHLRSVALAALARVKQETGDRQGALLDYQESLTAAESAGGRRAEAFALYGLGTLLLEMGELRTADDRFRASLPLFRVSCPDAEAAPIAALGVSCALRGAHADAARFFERADAALGPDARPIFRVALRVLRGDDFVVPAEMERLADVRLARRLKALFDGKSRKEPLYVAKDASFFRAAGGGETVVLTRRKALRGVLQGLIEARLARPGVEVSVDALVGLGWPNERMLREAGAERVYAAIATLRKLGLRGCIGQKGSGYLVHADVPVVVHEVPA